MSTRTILLRALGASALLACSSSRTDRPVVSQTEAGRAVSESGDSAAAKGVSLVRVVNAAGGGKALTVNADDRALFSSVAPDAVTEYAEVHDNLVSFDLHEAGRDSSVADNSELMTDGSRYTVVALPKESAGYQLRVLRDDLTPRGGKARVRLLNAAPRVDDVDLAVVGMREPLLDGVPFGVDAGFKDVDPTGSALELRIDGKPSGPVSLGTLRLAPGRAYTVILVRTPKGGLRTITFDDSLTPTTSGS